jgi:undecaprenyl-diphosphatase
MTIIQAIILGLVQGVTEFLPISSSGHLIIFPEVFNWPEQGFDFDALIHLATLIAVVWMFRSEIATMAKGVIKKGSPEGELGWKIILASVPIVIAGLILSNYLDTIRGVKIVAINLVIWGAVLWTADWYFSSVNHKVTDEKNIGWGTSLMIGVSQIISLIPGVSRSGITISAGLFSGLDRAAAARFSFLLAIPAILGAATMAVFDVFQNGLSTPPVALIVGFVSALVAGSLSIKFLLKFVTNSSYTWFAVYRIGLGLILLFWLC